MPFNLSLSSISILSLCGNHCDRSGNTQLLPLHGLFLKLVVLSIITNLRYLRYLDQVGRYATDSSALRAMNEGPSTSYWTIPETSTYTDFHSFLLSLLAKYKAFRVISPPWKSRLPASRHNLLDRESRCQRKRPNCLSMERSHDPGPPITHFCTLAYPSLHQQVSTKSFRKSIRSANHLSVLPLTPPLRILSLCCLRQVAVRPSSL